MIALLPLFALVGCKRTEHKNVIVGKVSNDTERVWLLHDIQSGQEIVFYYTKGNRKSPYDYLEVGDTVSLFTGGRFLSEDCYQKHLLLNFNDVDVKYNIDTIKARQKYQQFNQKIKTR